jgi:UDP-glucose 4-epimerase
VAGTGRFRYVDWPPEKKAIDIGSCYADSTRIRAALGWRATTLLADGLARTVEFYRLNLPHYVPTADQPPVAVS